jgi:3-methyl-2-oxobutanoate hydroxymethyltransferase
VRNFLAHSEGVDAAVRQYVADVKSGRFPDDTVHGY